MTALSKNRRKPVYERGSARRAVLGMLVATCLASPFASFAQPAGDAAILEAREAFRKKDGLRLALARASLVDSGHPLAVWVDYWELNTRLATAQQEDLEAFYARWPGSYLEDRLRNDWLLELGRRRDLEHIALEFPRFRMKDDREVACYALLADQRAGKPVVEAARTAWLAQRDADDGCALLATTLFEARSFTPSDVWTKTRSAMEANRQSAARQAAGLLGPSTAASVAEISDSPLRYLTRKASTSGRAESELTAMALVRLAGSDPDAAARLLAERWDRSLPADLAGWAWSGVAKQSAMKLLPEAADQYQRAATRSGKGSRELEVADDVLAWKVRSALRADNGKPRWQQVVQAINSMSASEQREAAWVYWKARALRAVALDSQEGESMRTMASELMRGIAGEMHFYGKLAAEHLQLPLVLPAPPQPLTSAERGAAARHPGLARALQLIAIGLRGEGVREWNFSLRGMGERELLAAAQLACDREVWDRCINTSERTQTEIDMAQRFPMPYRADVQARAREIGLDPAYVYGLIRQESRFIMDARSHVGASGLMQIMPATARWTAKKIGLDYSPDLIADRTTNLKLGTNYLKLVLDDFSGSQAMAAAAYNAGPGRPRRWREGPLLETAVWAENIPFAETRDYVKKVLSNATYYAALMSGQAPSLRARLGTTIGPREPAAAVPDKELP